VDDSFIDLGSAVTKDNDMTVEIHNRLLEGNNNYFGLLKHFVRSDIK
jgi:hypothetical protein